MKKLFGGINLTWPKLIVLAIIIGVYAAVMAMIPAARDTSFSDITVTFEVWIFFGIFIIMNSKSAKDSALKCFIFFLISQPIVYLVQDVINHSNLFFTYYRLWVGWTVACLPMGFVGYYMKKDKIWGLIILTPMLMFLGYFLSIYIAKTVFSFPRHILTVIFCVSTLVIYPLFIFKNKINRIIGVVVSILVIIASCILAKINPQIYSTEILSSNDNLKFDDSYKVYFIDNKYGDLSIKYEHAIDSWMVHAELKKAGKTSFILESPTGKKQKFDIIIKSDQYEVEEK